MTKFEPKPKQRKACWTTVKSPSFRAQAAALRPETGPAGGIRAQSGSQAARNTVYGAIRELYLTQNPVCQIAAAIQCTRTATEIHHWAKRDGLLLFDVRHFRAVCANCHAVIHQDETEARRRGWLAQPGQWNTLR